MRRLLALRDSEGRQVIPAEAVEAAAKAAGLVFDEPANARDIEYIRTILEAAAPYMQGAACADAYALGFGADEYANPYRSAE